MVFFPQWIQQEIKSTAEQLTDHDFGNLSPIAKKKNNKQCQLKYANSLLHME